MRYSLLSGCLHVIIIINDENFCIVCVCNYWVYTYLWFSLQYEFHISYKNIKMIENLENTFNIFSNNLQSLVNETLETSLTRTTLCSYLNSRLELLSNFYEFNTHQYQFIYKQHNVMTILCHFLVDRAFSFIMMSFLIFKNLQFSSISLFMY